MFGIKLINALITSNSMAKQIVMIESEDFKIETIKKEGEEDKVIFSGLALPFGKESRNGHTYNTKRASKVSNTLKNKSFLFNHNYDNVLGHTTDKVSVDKEGIYYEVDIDPEEKDFIRKAKRKDIQNVSVGVIIDEVLEKEGKPPELLISEFIELSAVTVPGFQAADLNSNEFMTMENFIKEKPWRKGKREINKYHETNKGMADDETEPTKDKEETEALIEGMKEGLTKLTERMDSYEERIAKLEESMKDTNEAQEKLIADNKRVETKLADNTATAEKVEYTAEGLLGAIGDENE